jgi:hypothetical protein
MLRISQCLDNRFIDGGKVVGLMQRPRSTPQKHFSFLLEAEYTPGMVRPEGLDKLKEKKFIHLIGSRTRDLSACSIVHMQ